MKKPAISIIAAIGKGRELGKENQLLWKIPEDLKRFKELTLGHPVIMGQKTFESIGKKLPERENIILTQDEKFRADDCEICYSIGEALEKANSYFTDEIFVIGGGQIYKQFLPLAGKLYLTAVDSEDPSADTYFPDYSEFRIVNKIGSGTYGNLKYEFLELTRE